MMKIDSREQKRPARSLIQGVGPGTQEEHGNWHFILKVL
jgi:hypothetical protein